MDIKQKKFRINNPTGRENVVQVACFYDKGGYDIFGGSCSRRGYYISAQKAELGRGMVSVNILEGRKMLICEVSRQSKKAEEKALAYFEENAETFAKQVYPNCELEENAT